MDFKLKGKVSVVCASSKGLGRAVAIALAKEGSNIVLCARNEKTLLKTKKEIEEYGTQVLAIKTDLSQHKEVEYLIKETINRFGGIDNLIVNCGGPPSGRFSDFSVDDWKERQLI